MVGKIKIPGLIDITKNFRNPNVMRISLNIFKLALRAATLPIIRDLNPWTKPEETNMFWIPVNKAIERAPDVPLPYEVVEEFIDRASYRFIMKICGCRQAFGCRDYPIDVGCLMMGDDARKINPAFGHAATKTETREHLQRAMEAGLAPFIGKARVDNFIFGVPDTGRLLSVCFCCECCSVTRWTRFLPSENRNRIMHRLEGLELWVDQEACLGCGKCREHCFIKAISLANGKAAILPECRGCGRCVPVCPRQAIHIALHNPTFMDETVRSIESFVKL